MRRGGGTLTPLLLFISESKRWSMKREYVEIMKRKLFLSNSMR
jgi:hypothetical protein